jgi:hypothetical protein
MPFIDEGYVDIVRYIPPGQTRPCEYQSRQCRDRIAYTHRSEWVCRWCHRRLNICTEEKPCKEARIYIETPMKEWFKKYHNVDM